MSEFYYVSDSLSFEYKIPKCHNWKEADKFAEDILDEQEYLQSITIEERTIYCISKEPERIIDLKKRKYYRV